MVAAAALAPAAADARPTADVVIVWAPGTAVAPVEQVARDAGAAVIDRTPRPRPPLETRELLRRGIAAYDTLQLGDAAHLLEDARALADRTGGAELSQSELADLFLYRGLVKIQQGDATAAWDELVTSVIVAPTRVLDPARFPPRVASELERVRSSLADRRTARLTVEAPAGCAVTIDGSAVASPGDAVPRLLGPHWVSVTCPDRAPWGTRLELTDGATLVARNAPLAAPSPDELLIQARTVGARAFVVVEVAGAIGTARLIGIDGRERDRRTVNVQPSVAPLASAVGELIAPAAPTRWYQERWVWAVGAAAAAAAILVPLTALTAGDRSPDTWSGALEGVPPWR